MAPDQQSQQMHSPMGGDPSYATLTILQAMRTTKPWITMFAVLSFIGAAFLLLGALFALAAGSLAGPFAMMGPLVGLFYVFLAGVYGYCGVLLWGYRSGIDQYIASQGELESLAAAMTKQASFWRFVGILTAVLLVLYFGIFLFALAGAASR